MRKRIEPGVGARGGLGGGALEVARRNAQMSLDKTLQILKIEKLICRIDARDNKGGKTCKTSIAH
jgi:glycerate kinase